MQETQQNDQIRNRRDEEIEIDLWELFLEFRKHILGIVLAGLIGASQPQSTKPAGLGGLLSGLFGASQPQTQNADSNPLGSMMGSMMGDVDITSMLSGFLGAGK